MGTGERESVRSRVRTAVLPGSNLPALVVTLVIASVAALYVLLRRRRIGTGAPPAT